MESPGSVDMLHQSVQPTNPAPEANQVNQPTSPFASPTAPTTAAKSFFPWDELPPELQRDNLTFAIPHGHSFRFKATWATENFRTPQWDVLVRPLDDSPPGLWQCIRRGDPPPDTPVRPAIQNHVVADQLATYAMLLSMSKAMEQEARAIFFGNNEICLHVHSCSHSPHPFGPFLRYPHRRRRVHTLRDVVNLKLIMNVGIPESEACRRLRSRFEQVVEQLALHADDPGEKSLLKKISVRVACSGYEVHGPQAVDPINGAVHWNPVEMLKSHIALCRFSIEPLVELRYARLAIENVSIVGFEPWFKESLEMLIKGGGTGSQKIDWPTKRVRARANESGRRPRKKVEVTTIGWHQAVWDWRGWAERNGVRIQKELLEVETME